MHIRSLLSRVNNNTMLQIIEDYRKATYPHHTFCSAEMRCVYVFFNPLSNFSKIGITNEPKTRLRHLQRQSGINIHQLILIELEPGYDETAPHVEEFLHRYFKAKRKIGEWFDLSVRDLIQIRALFYHIEGDYIWDSFRELSKLRINNKYPIQSGISTIKMKP